MGDPAGVGPELCLALLQDEAFLARHDLLLFGSLEVLKSRADDSRPFDPSCVVDAGPVEDLVPGEVSAATGEASFRYLDQARQAVESGEAKALVTCPVNKEALAAAGVPDIGDPAFFAGEYGTGHHFLMVHSPELTCSLVTGNMGLAEVPAALTVESVLEVIKLTAHAITAVNGRGARIAVLGLNPHAGEHGLFGDEELHVIQPAIKAANEQGIDAVGPLPPDTAFLPGNRPRFDAYVCMYHDQGLIALKTIDFEHAVNATLGLPIVHTSVSHGTALDIAGKGVADTGPLFAAVNFATRLVH